MPSKKKKYNARFPAGRIKKIMQSDEEVGKVAQAVPVIISRTLELFVESLLTKTLRITNSRNAKTLSPSHMKQCIMSENQFDFLRELVKNIPDISVNEEYGNLVDGSMPVSPCLESPPLSIQPLTPVTPIQQEPYDLSRPSTSCEYNFAKNLTSSLQQQQHPVGIRISNGQSSLLVRNVSNGTSNNTQIGLSSATITAPTPSQGIEITCKESVIAKISIPSLPADNNASGNKITEIDLGLRNDLKRSWDSISRLRHQTQLPFKNSTNIQSTASSSNINVASPSEIYSSSFKNSSLSDIRDSSLLPSPAKLSRLDFNSKEQHNITPSATINNSPTTLSKEKEIFKKSDNIKKEKQKLIMQEPIISIDENVSNKPIVKIDYSNLQLLQNDCNNSKKIENNDKLIKQITPTTVTPELTNSPVINIDLSKIGTQPPTINFNFNNLLTCDSNVSKNSMISTSSSNTLELDEDYDNI